MNSNYYYVHVTAAGLRVGMLEADWDLFGRKVSQKRNSIFESLEVREGALY